jgi:hypothetical protein
MLAGHSHKFPSYFVLADREARSRTSLKSGVNSGMLSSACKHKGTILDVHYALFFCNEHSLILWPLVGSSCASASQFSLPDFAAVCSSPSPSAARCRFQSFFSPLSLLACVVTGWWTRS